MHVVAIIVSIVVVYLLYPNIKPLISEYRKPVENTKVMQTIKGTPKEGVVSEYVPGEPIEENDGHHALIVDNSNNEMPVYARLWTTGENPRPIRAFTICEHGSFQLDNIPSGEYEIRFKMLYEGSDAAEGYKINGLVMQPELNEGEIQYPIYRLQIALHNGKGKQSIHTMASEV